MNRKILNRREFLKLAGLTALGTVGACTMSKPVEIATPTAQSTETSTPTIQPTASPEPVGQRKRVLRIAHMTDFHARPEGIAPDGIVRALRHAQSQADPPDIIFNGCRTYFFESEEVER
jgi:hypothetical protein